MARYRPGELDQLIDIQRFTDTPDNMGGASVRAWASIGEVWAHVRTTSGGEPTNFDRVNETASAMFVIRWPTDITAKDRIVWDGVEYNVRFIRTPKGRDLYAEIETTRGEG